MANSGGKITAPVSIPNDVAPVLGVGSYSLAYLCSNRHGKTNVWSRCKPVITSLTTDSADWWKSYNGNCGFVPKIVAGYNNIPSAMDGGMNGWVYQPPTDGNYHRTLFFDGYYHYARAPFRDFSITPASIDNKSGSQFGAALIAYLPATDVLLDELTAKDFGLAGYYFGVYAKQDNGAQARRATASIPIGGGGISVVINAYGMPTGTWTVYPFLAENPIGQNDADKINNYYTIPNVAPAKLEIVSSLTTLMIKSTPVDSMGYTTWTIRFTNGGYSTLNLTNNYIQFRFPKNDWTDPFQIGESQEKLEDFTLAAGASKTITGTKYLSEELRSSCKIWVSLQSGNYRASTLVMQPITM